MHIDIQNIDLHGRNNIYLQLVTLTPLRFKSGSHINSDITIF
jgi:hypothetical protein